jgi:ATP-dependent helicase/nuclease subunit A
VGGDFVLDHKTDAEVSPDEHRFQLWAYARAFNKPRALIAYLRHDKLHEFDAARLTELDAEANALIGGILKCDYTPRPSPAACGYCPYRTICPSAAA